MGTQQLLLIVISVFVVGLTIFAGYNLILNYLQSSNREQLISTLQNLCVSAQQYYKKPREQGGGDGSFIGWSIPSQLQRTDAGTFRAVVKEDKINFNAIGTQPGLNGKSEVCVDATVDSREIKFIVIN